MKPSIECLRCLITTRLREVERSRLADSEKLFIARRVVEEIINNFNFEIELTKFATWIYKYLVIIAPDVVEYYRELKSASNRIALKAIKEHEEYAEALKDFEKFKYLVKLSATANLLDYGVAEHSPIENPLPPDIVDKYSVAVDHVDKLYSKVSRGGLKIAWLFDNAGEAVYDSLLLVELKKHGNYIIGFLKDEPGFQNDVTINDVLSIGLDRLLDELVVYGSSSTIHLDSISEEARRAIEKVDLLIAKGMSNYEYLSEVEIGKPICFILIPKCDVVARSIGGDSKGKIVVLCRGL
jgi:uncharacterized protein with ATP-grasp and redox domains